MTPSRYLADNIGGKTEDLTADKVREAFQKACKKVKCRIGCPYDLRKSFATKSLTKFKLETVQEILRHKHFETTHQSYAKTMGSEKAFLSEGQHLVTPKLSQNSIELFFRPCNIWHVKKYLQNKTKLVIINYINQEVHYDISNYS